MTRDELCSILKAVHAGRLVEISDWEVIDMPGGWLVTCTFYRPDRDTLEPSIGQGRAWRVGEEFSTAQVVRTAFSAVKMLVDHELLEFFKVGGERVFDPHERSTAHGETRLGAR